MVYERSKEKRIRDEKQRHNDNDDQHNEVFEFSHYLSLPISLPNSQVFETFRVITIAPVDLDGVQAYPY
jgi:hypothetical protein